MPGQAMRGIQFVHAVTLLAELGDLTRFGSARQLMGYLGLVPREDSSGEHRRQGSITKAGNSYARRALIEAAWAYRHPARVTRTSSPPGKQDYRKPPATSPRRRSCACQASTGA
jgi:transposase